MTHERSREVQTKAILGPFSGDRTKAVEYCIRVAELHPKLRAEYLMSKQTIEWEPQEDAKETMVWRERNGF